ncbi:serine hydrolase [Microbispora sp. H10830]|uniref:serine hydrolase domain-containing protein n=1 Tax=Microbispora sp. H10830 TaxID=2729109 RepID=UPI001602A18D|nr:serine hydrolase domain-containing protein [Microbispora sp. H10830]
MKRSSNLVAGSLVRAIRRSSGLAILRRCVGQATYSLVRVRGEAGSRTGSSGVRDLRTGGRVPDDARFRIGSVTKVFTATVVLQLVGEGKIDLDGTVQHYLPGPLPASYPPVTVAQLLNHTSGLPSPTLPDDDQWILDHRYDTWTPQQWMDGVAKNPMEFTRWSSRWARPPRATRPCCRP